MRAAERTPMSFARSSGRGRAVYIDTVTLALVLAILLFGLIMMTSASISIAAQYTGQPFYFLERQLIAVAIGVAGAVVFLPVKGAPSQAARPWVLDAGNGFLVAGSGAPFGFAGTSAGAPAARPGI